MPFPRFSDVFKEAPTLESSGHARHCLSYHIVWCTKYRHPVLVKSVAKFCYRKIVEVCRDNGWDPIALDVQADHVHLFVQMPLDVCLPDAIRLLKSVTAVAIFEKYRNLKGQKFWGSGLWSRGYFVSSVGNVEAEKIKAYIENQ